MEENVVFIGNLKKDAKKKDLKDSIYDLFKHYLLISIRYNGIEIKGKNNRRRHAFVQLKSKEDVDKAVNALGTKVSRKQLKFNFLCLVEPSQILKVNVKFQGINYYVDNQSETRNNHSERRNQHSNKLNGHYPQPLIDNGGKTPSNQNSHGGSGMEQTSSFRSQKSADSNSRDKKQYYEDGEMLGNETRNKEFKEGGGDYVNRNLKDHVSKYLCGFLNSSQQGTLFIGVKDNGSVVGVKCDQKTEDNIRIIIDQAIKTIRPAIFPQNYHVKFVPVRYNTGGEKVNFKVIEITVDKVDSLTLLYEAAGDVYIRRDGSLQGPLKPLEIQEWARQNHQTELKAVQRRHKEELQRHRTRVCVVM